MSTSAKVTNAAGTEVEITVFTPEELVAFFGDQSGPGKKAAMAYLRLLARPVNEIVKMDAAARVKWVQEQYTELGVASAAPKSKGAIGKPNGAAAPANGLKNGKAPIGASRSIGGKGAVPKAAAVEEEVEEDEVVAAPATTTKAAVGGDGAVLKAIKELSGAVSVMRDEGLDLQRQVLELQEQNLALTTLVQQQEKTLLDVHLIVRVIARAGHDFDDEVIQGFAAECYDTLVTEPVEEGEAELAEEQQLEGNA